MSILSDYGKVLPQFFTEEPRIMRLAIGVGSTAVQIDDSSVGLSFTLADSPVTPHWAGIAPRQDRRTLPSGRRSGSAECIPG